VKPGNILLFLDDATDRGLVAKVSDFGLSGIISSDDKTRGGTSYWNAPEIISRGQSLRGETINGEDFTDPADFYSDVYCFGLVAMFVAMDSEFPFDLDTFTEMKLSDGVFDCVKMELEARAGHSGQTPGQRGRLVQLAGQTLRLSRHDRSDNLSGVRDMLCQRQESF
jgi:serine/threonine protein kinase